MNAKEIYDILRAGGLSRAGALGMLGNMMAESSLRPNIAQRGMTNLSDAEYTRQADEGLLDFTKPVGYGLCQWTYHTRKAALMAYAKEMNTSVGDGVMQTYFCLHELREDFPAVYHTLCSSSNIDECADLICVRYECPAVNNYATRRNYAHTFDKDIPDAAEQDAETTAIVRMLQTCMAQNGYWSEEKIDGQKTSEFREAIVEYAADVAKS